MKPFAILLKINIVEDSFLCMGYVNCKTFVSL
jgi:hypothetical protein